MHALARARLDRPRIPRCLIACHMLNCSVSAHSHRFGGRSRTPQFPPPRKGLSGGLGRPNIRPGQLGRGRVVGEERRQALYGRVRFLLVTPSRAIMSDRSLALGRPAAKSRAILTGRAGGVTHRTYFCAFFRSAQRFFIASEIRFRAAADIVRRLADLLVLPGGLPRRLPRPPTPSRAWIAASSLLRCCLSCWTTSARFMPEC